MVQSVVYCPCYPEIVLAQETASNYPTEKLTSNSKQVGVESSSAISNIGAFLPEFSR